MNHHVRFRIQLKGGIFDHVEVCIFLAFGATFGLPQDALRSGTSPNMIFGMSFDSLMPLTRKINGSKKSQSLGSEIMCHHTLRLEREEIARLYYSLKKALYTIWFYETSNS